MQVFRTVSLIIEKSVCKESGLLNIDTSQVLYVTSLGLNVNRNVPLALGGLLVWPGVRGDGDHLRALGRGTWGYMTVWSLLLSRVRREHSAHRPLPVLHAVHNVLQSHLERVILHSPNVIFKTCLKNPTSKLKLYSFCCSHLRNIVEARRNIYLM